jgi:soluble lytic murein transglycosylase-like protein
MAERFGVEGRLVRAIIYAESRGNPDAISHDGARGVMQLMPSTARDYRRIASLQTLHDPRVNVRIGTRHLARLVDRVERRFPVVASRDVSRVKLVAAAYNAGWHRVRQYHGVPPFAETQTYVDRVWARYRALGPVPSI